MVGNKGIGIIITRIVCNDTVAVFILFFVILQNRFAAILPNRRVRLVLKRLKSQNERERRINGCKVYRLFGLFGAFAEIFQSAVLTFYQQS